MMKTSWTLPKNDPWSTPFAEGLLSELQLEPGLKLLDVACGGAGIPAFYLADQIGPTGHVLAMDISPAQITRARARKGNALPWLELACIDVHELPPSLPSFDRITGNLSFMFFRPNRFETLKNLISHLKPGGQIVLTFPSLGTFDSLWQRIDLEMAHRKLIKERQALATYIAERPSAQAVKQWFAKLKMEKVVLREDPLEISIRPGPPFLYHPLLRGGFLEDAYECFTDPELAEEVMVTVSNDIDSFLPLNALRCTMSAWKPRV
jgi:ubiquinone/menaquinone biosynthesis C-methylase UbiE